MSRWRMSACAETFVRRSVTVTRTPGLSSRCFCTSSFARVMSALTVSWNAGTVHACVSRRAIVLRTFDVGRDDAAFRSGAREGRQLDPALAGDAARERRSFHAAVRRAAVRRSAPALDRCSLGRRGLPARLAVRLPGGRLGGPLRGRRRRLLRLRGVAVGRLHLLALGADEPDRLADGNLAFL